MSWHPLLFQCKKCHKYMYSKILGQTVMCKCGNSVKEEENNVEVNILVGNVELVGKGESIRDRAEASTPRKKKANG